MNTNKLKQRNSYRLITFLPIVLFAISTSLSGNAIADNPKVKMVTNKGTVVLELFEDKAPITVENFLHYVNEGKYNNTVFHRVIKDFVNQGGGYSYDYKLVETFPPIKNEADNGLENKRGTIAMARTNEPDSAKSQFFINMADNIILDHVDKTDSGWGYCVFGRVTEGMDVMDRISRTRTKGFGPFPADAPMIQVTIRSISVVDGE